MNDHYPNPRPVPFLLALLLISRRISSGCLVFGFIPKPTLNR